VSLVPVKGFLHSASRGIGSLVFPDLCPCCLREGQWESCLALWRSEASLRFIGKVPVISTVAYDDRAMSVVLAAKERGERRAKKFLTLAISTGITRLDFKRPKDSLRVIIPIPSSKRAIRRRGEDFINGSRILLTPWRSMNDDWRRDCTHLISPVRSGRGETLRFSSSMMSLPRVRRWRPRYRRYHTLLSECAHRSRVSLPATPREGSEHLL